MALVNENFLKLSESYLFANIAKKVAACRAAHPDKKIISLGIGDVTRPLCPAVIEAMHKAVSEMADKATFRGYGPEQGYDFLREAIVEHDYKSRGIAISTDEVFVNDGAKSDTGNISEIVSWRNRVGITDPVYPVYVDSNVMAGRTGTWNGTLWSDITYLPCTDHNDFVPQLPDHRIDMVYLCYPNNPTGTVLSRKELKKWVDFAHKNDTLILYDAAYEAYIRDEDIPHSIYEIEGADNVAIEFRSFSKTAGFTGVRCGYTVVPKKVTALAADGKSRVELNHLWNRRQCTKFNGTSYISQRAAEAVYSVEGQRQVRETIDYYMENARLMRDALTCLGIKWFGGRNAPYIWMKTPHGEDSWSFFDKLLHEVGVVCTPGVGFGPSGEGFVRLTAFGNKEDCEEAMMRIKVWMEKK